ncbi:MAG: pentapeptide repeat-containing protein [Planctomycetota bacterium]
MPFSHSAEYIEQAFEKVEYSNKKILAKEFVECSFVQCDFSESVFQNCKFMECEFQQCNLSLLKLIGSSFANTRFEDSKVIGVNWTEISWPKIKLSYPIKFVKCDISLSTFIGLDLREIVIKECRACDVDFREADLTKAELACTDFSKSQFFETNLTSADFSYARNYSIDIYQNKITKAKFSLPEALSLLDAVDIELK